MRRQSSNNNNSVVNFIFDANLSLLALKDKAFNTYNQQLLTDEFWKDLLIKYISVAYHEYVHHELVELFLAQNGNEILQAYSAYINFLETQPTAEELLREVIAKTEVNQFSDVTVLVNDVLPQFKYAKESFQIIRRLHNEFFKKVHGITQQQLDLIDELLSEFSNCDGDAPTNREAVMEFYNKMRKAARLDVIPTSKSLTKNNLLDTL